MKKPNVKKLISLILAMALLVCLPSITPGNNAQITLGDSVDSLEADEKYDQYNSEPEQELTSDSVEYKGVTKSGKCGENVTWRLSPDGALVISGNGSMYDNGHDWIGTWYNYEVRSVVVSAGVTSLRQGDLFKGCENLISVSLPNTLSEINDSLFVECKNLTSISIPEGVISIGGWAFKDCENLSSVSIPDSVTSIGNDTFNGCKSLKSIFIPQNVSQIGENCFVSCSSLENIYVDDRNQYYDSIDGILFSKDHSRLYTYPAAKSGVKYSIPSEVTAIEKSAFYGNSFLQTVDIPNSITKIPFEAFRGCSQLTYITIPDSVEEIEQNVFNGCSSLTHLSLPGIPNAVKWQTNFRYTNKPIHIHIPSNKTPEDYMGSGDMPINPVIYHPVDVFGCCEDANCPLNRNTEPALDISDHSGDDLWEKDFEYTNNTGMDVTSFSRSFHSGGQLADYSTMYIVYPDETIEIFDINDGRLDEENSDMLLPALLEEEISDDIQTQKLSHRVIPPDEKVFGYLSRHNIDDLIN